MAPVLVTGGTGFLGEHVVRELSGAGAGEIRVLVRGTYEAAFEPRVESLRGDVVEDHPGEVPLAEAISGCETVYHLAGIVSRDAAAASAMMRVHVDGTRRLLHAAKAAAVRRVVVASSSGTMAVSRQSEPILDEDAPYAHEVVGRFPYYLSKIYQETVALDLGRRLGIEVVIVNPSLLLGPGDRRQSSTGDVLRFLRRQIPVIPSGGISFVDARDAATATVAAMERGRPGRRYLLGGPNWTAREFLGRLERASKVSGPVLRLPHRLRGAASFGAGMIGEVFKRLDRDSPIDEASVEMGQLFWYCDSTRARDELGFAPRDPGETLDETIRWLRAHVRV